MFLRRGFHQSNVCGLSLGLETSVIERRYALKKVCI
jgi:hypothetical protein